MGCGASSEAYPVTPHPRGYQPKAPGHSPSSSPARATELDKSRRSGSSVLTTMMGVKECKSPVWQRSVDMQVHMKPSRRHPADLHNSHASSRRSANSPGNLASIPRAGGVERLLITALSLSVVTLEPSECTGLACTRLIKGLV